MRILFISANPKWTDQLQLGDELRTLMAALKGLKVDLTLLPAAQREDLEKALGGRKVHVVHFSGHAEEAGILLRDADGYPQTVEGKDLHEMLRGQGVKLVVLNACNTEKTANEIEGTVDGVIGTKEPLDDRAARRMTKVLYSSLRAGASPLTAFEDAGKVIREEKLPFSYIKAGSELDQPVFDTNDLVDGQINIDGEEPFDRYFFVSYLDEQIRNLLGRIYINRFWFAVLSIAGIALFFWLIGNTPPQIFEFVRNPENAATIFGSPLLDQLKALGTAIPAMFSALYARLLIHGNGELRRLKRLKQLTRSSDDMTPELRKTLAKILDQNISGADPEYANRGTYVDWYGFVQDIMERQSRNPEPAPK